MSAIFSYKCSCCGNIHEGSPSIGFSAPDHYNDLTDEQKTSLGTLSSDFCTIAHGENTDYFVRAILEIPIHGVADPFLWGVWVSLSEKSFNRYRETYDNPSDGEEYFGWLCNVIPPYPFDEPRATDVMVRTNNQRPKVLLHTEALDSDPLIADQVNGISIARAQAIAEQCLHGS